MTREISARFGDDLVGGFRRTAAEAFAALDAIPGEVFQARRGPIARDDYLLTRLLELVVHGDDLQRALGRTDAPLLPRGRHGGERRARGGVVERVGAPPAVPAWSGSAEPPAGCPTTTRTCRCSQHLRCAHAHVHFTVATTSTPEQFVAGLTDFGPGRQELFANSADSSLEVHDQGPGSRRRDRRVGRHLGTPHSTTGPIRTTSSSRRPTPTCSAAASGHTYTLTRRPDGTTEVDVVVVREGKNLRGRLLSALLGTVGRGLLERRFKGTVTAIEARNQDASEPS